eukprot:s359_g17.t1
MQLAVSLGMPGARVRKKSEEASVFNGFNLGSQDSGLQGFCTSLRVCPQGVERKQEKCGTADARICLELVHRIHGLPLLAMRNSFEIRVRDRMRGETTSFEKLTPASQTAAFCTHFQKAEVISMN